MFRLRNKQTEEDWRDGVVVNLPVHFREMTVGLGCVTERSPYVFLCKLSTACALEYWDCD